MAINSLDRTLALLDDALDGAVDAVKAALDVPVLRGIPEVST